MSQRVFKALVGGIGNLRKHAERRHVHKHRVIEHTYVAGKYLALYRHLRRALHGLWQAQTVGKIVGTACGNIADFNSSVALHHTGYHFVQRAVPTAAYNPVIGVVPLPCHVQGIAPLLCHMHRHFISVLNKDVQNAQQAFLNLSFAGKGIDNKKHLLFRHRLLLLRGKIYRLFAGTVCRNQSALSRAAELYWMEVTASFSTSMDRCIPSLVYTHILPFVS